MTSIHPSFVFELAAVLGAGLALGLLHYRSLHQVSDDYLGAHVGRALALQLARMCLMIAFLAALAWLGPAFLLAGALGPLAGRFVVVRRAMNDR